MPRGKPFICWLKNEKHINTYPLCQGDAVFFELDEGSGWILGIIHCLKNQYIFRERNGKKHSVFMTTQLRAVEQAKEINDER